MTEQPQQHCEHECVCPTYGDGQDSYVHGKVTHAVGSCVNIPCPNDTRSRPAPSHTDEEWMELVKQAMLNGIVAGSAKAREDVLEDVLEELYSLAEDMILDGQRILREEPDVKLYGKGKSTAANVFQMRIESLRSTKGGEQ